MKATSFLASVILLLVGGGSGFFWAHQIYTPQIKQLNIEAAELTDEVTSLTNTANKLRGDIYSLTTELDSASADLTRMQAERDRFKTEVASYQAYNFALRQQLTSASEDLDSVLKITIKQNYVWNYGGYDWQWEIPVSLAEYVEYRDKERPFSGRYFVDMTRDTGDNAFLDNLISRIDEAAKLKYYTEVQKLNFVVAFVQSLPYTVDNETTPYDEYPRYPIETLFDRGGDCEDTSILVAAILDRMGYDVALLLLPDASHMAVGIVSPYASGSYYSLDGKKYFYLETTGEGWPLGEIPPDIGSAKARVYPVRD